MCIGITDHAFVPATFAWATAPMGRGFTLPLTPACGGIAGGADVTVLVSCAYLRGQNAFAPMEFRPLGTGRGGAFILALRDMIPAFATFPHRQVIPFLTRGRVSRTIASR